jgi:hypothetical protein
VVSLHNPRINPKSHKFLEENPLMFAERAERSEMTTSPIILKMTTFQKLNRFPASGRKKKKRKGKEKETGKHLHTWMHQKRLT